MPTIYSEGYSAIWEMWAKDFDTYEVHVEPDRRVPEPIALNEFLTDQLSSRARDKIRLWLK